MRNAALLYTWRNGQVSVFDQSSSPLAASAGRQSPARGTRKPCIRSNNTLQLAQVYRVHVTSACPDKFASALQSGGHAGSSTSARLRSSDPWRPPNWSTRHLPPASQTGQGISSQTVSVPQLSKISKRKRKVIAPGYYSKRDKFYSGSYLVSKYCGLMNTNVDRIKMPKKKGELSFSNFFA